MGSYFVLLSTFSRSLLRTTYYYYYHYYSELSGLSGGLFLFLESQICGDLVPSSEAHWTHNRRSCILCLYLVLMDFLFFRQVDEGLRLCLLGLIHAHGSQIPKYSTLHYTRQAELLGQESRLEGAWADG